MEKGGTDEACVDQSTENEAVAGLAEPRRWRILLPERPLPWGENAVAM